MTEILRYIAAAEVAEYTAQGWVAWRLTGHHGMRRGYGMRNFIAVLHL